MSVSFCGICKAVVLLGSFHSGKGIPGVSTTVNGITSQVRNLSEIALLDLFALFRNPTEEEIARIFPATSTVFFSVRILRENAHWCKRRSNSVMGQGNGSA
jgi:hypothetical protein